ncbi:MAG: hopanoid biosynthesis-associated protein HpnK [Stellaceae bacterium]
MKRLIVTADDFGLSSAVNRAIEAAHRDGILSAASLMVAGDAAADAVARARLLPGLGIGLHLVLCDGRPVLPPERLPHLVDASGNFPNALARLGTLLQFSAAARAEAATEMRAQFAAFRATGLALDHVNAHHHFHFHPWIAGMVIALAQEYGAAAVRLPREPMRASWRAAGDRAGPRLLNKLMLVAFTDGLRRRLDRAGIRRNDWIWGLSDSGAMDAARTLKLLAHLPHGVSEIYFHPCADPADPRFSEYQALLDPRVAALVKAKGLTPLPFAALAETS